MCSGRRARGENRRPDGSFVVVRGELASLWRRWHLKALLVAPPGVGLLVAVTRVDKVLRVLEEVAKTATVSRRHLPSSTSGHGDKVTAHPLCTGSKDVSHHVSWLLSAKRNAGSLDNIFYLKHKVFSPTGPSRLPIS